jgi:integrase-like protein
MPQGERGTSKPYLRGEIWWIRYKVPGEERERFESSKSTNKNDAIRLLNKRRKEIDDRQATSTDATVGDLLKLYLEDQRRQSRHSFNQAEGYVRLHLEPAFGPIKASKLQSNHIEAFIDQKQTAKYANATINRWLEALRRGYALGLKKLPPLVYVVPDIKASMLEENNVRERFLEHEQAIHLVARRAAGSPAVDSGDRIPPRHAPWRDPQPPLGSGRLGRKYHPAGEKADQRETGACSALYGDLRAWLDMAYAAREADCPVIVSWKGHGISDVKTAWNKARERAGVPELLIRDLRRTAARNMIRAGVPEKQVLLIVGWKTRAMLDRYNITDERDIQVAGQKLADYLEQKAELAKVRTKVRTAKEAAEGRNEKEGLSIQ